MKYKLIFVLVLVFLRQQFQKNQDFQQ
jgi:hypothetical protein